MRDVLMAGSLDISRKRRIIFFHCCVRTPFSRTLLRKLLFSTSIIMVLGVIILLLMIITSFWGMFYLGTNVLLGSDVITNLALLYLLWSKNC